MKGFPSIAAAQSVVHLSARRRLHGARLILRWGAARSAVVTGVGHAAIRSDGLMRSHGSSAAGIGDAVSEHTKGDGNCMRGLG